MAKKATTRKKGGRVHVSHSGGTTKRVAAKKSGGARVVYRETGRALGQNHSGRAKETEEQRNLRLANQHMLRIWTDIYQSKRG